MSDPTRSLFRTDEFELPLIPHGDSFRVNGPLVARQLGFRKAADMVRYLDDDEKILVRDPDENVQVTRGASLRLPSEQGFSGALAGHGVWYLTEPGFYRVVGQRNTSAGIIKDPQVREFVIRFQRWVFHEVLPAMLRTGQASDLALAGVAWNWYEVSAEIRQRYGLDWKPTQITNGARSAGWLREGSTAPKWPHRHHFWFTGTAWNLLPHALPDLVADLVETMRKLGDPQAHQYQLAIFPTTALDAPVRALTAVDGEVTA